MARSPPSRPRALPGEHEAEASLSAGPAPSKALPREPTSPILSSNGDSLKNLREKRPATAAGGVTHTGYRRPHAHRPSGQGCSALHGARRRTHAHWRSIHPPHPPPRPDSRRQGRPVSVAHARSGPLPPSPPPPSPLSAGACAVRVSRFPPPAALPFPLPGVLGSAERPVAGTVAAAGVRVQRRGGSAPAPARPTAPPVRRQPQL